MSECFIVVSAFYNIPSHDGIGIRHTCKSAPQGDITDTKGVHIAIDINLLLVQIIKLLPYCFTGLPQSTHSRSGKHSTERSATGKLISIE